VAVICSTDETYPELVPPLPEIKALCPGMCVVLAGAPAPEYKDSYVAAGVDEFIHVRANFLPFWKKFSAKGGCSDGRKTRFHSNCI
jgi:methylmalonyl-CoA mutase